MADLSGRADGHTFVTGIINVLCHLERMMIYQSCGDAFVEGDNPRESHDHLFNCNYFMSIRRHFRLKTNEKWSSLNLRLALDGLENHTHEMQDHLRNLRSCGFKGYIFKMSSLCDVQCIRTQCPIAGSIKRAVTKSGMEKHTIPMEWGVLEWKKFFMATISAAAKQHKHTKAVPPVLGERSSNVGNVGAGNRETKGGDKSGVAKKKIMGKHVLTSKGKKIFNPYAKA